MATSTIKKKEDMPIGIAHISGNQTLANIKANLTESGVAQVYYDDSEKGFSGWGILLAHCDNGVRTALLIANNKIGLLHTSNGGTSWVETIW